MTEYFRRAMRRWYVIVLSVVAAVALVFLHGVSGATKQSAATASVYLGQPFSPGGASVLTSTPLSNPQISIQYVTAPQQIAKAAAAAFAICWGAVTYWIEIWGLESGVDVSTEAPPGLKGWPR